MTWLLLETSHLPTTRYQRAVAGLGRDIFTLAFLRHIDRETAVSHRPAAAGWRLANKDLTRGERERLQRFAGA